MNSVKWLLGLPENRRLLPWLASANLLSSVYGFLWYRQQLSASPGYLWPVIPDSPLAALVFGIFLTGLVFGRRQPLLEAFAHLSMVKYGLWTVLVLGWDMLLHGVRDFETIHLSLSHLVMAVEAMVFLRVYHPGMAAGLAAWSWFLFNDFMDYIWGTHPILPDPGQIVYVRGVAVFTSLAAFLVFWHFRRLDRQKILS